MKNYFIQLLKYDRYANYIIFNALTEAGSPKRAVTLMAHLLAAQQIWLGRCKSETLVLAQFPDWQADTFARLINANNQQWLVFLAGLKDEDFEKMVHYQNSSGKNFDSKISDIITQVTNHGTHHRAQIGQVLKSAGIEKLPATDYIFYLRQ